MVSTPFLELEFRSYILDRAMKHRIGCDTPKRQHAASILRSSSGVSIAIKNCFFSLKNNSGTKKSVEMNSNIYMHAPINLL